MSRGAAPGPERSPGGGCAPWCRNRALGSWLVALGLGIPVSASSLNPVALEGSAAQGIEATRPPAVGGSPSDSLALLREAREAQARFERTRVRHAPWGQGLGGGGCDERVGRFCLRFTPGGDPDPPPRPVPEEAEGVERARAVLDSILTDAAILLPGDAWISGQRTFYRIDGGDLQGAVEAARACRSPEAGWCDLLRGFALARGGEVGPAEQAFGRALDALPMAEREHLLDPGVLLEPEVSRVLRALSGEDRSAWVDRIWAMGNPFALSGGNALLVEHLARHVQARIQAEARNPYALSWGRDMEEILVRFGPEVAWERVREVGMTLAPAPVTGRFHPGNRGVLPSLRALEDPGEATHADFPLRRGGTRAAHRVSGIEHLRPLRAATARVLREGTGHLLVGWEIPTPPTWDSVPPPTPDRGGIWVRTLDGREPVASHPLGAGPGEGASGGAAEPGAVLARGAALLPLPGPGGWLSVEFLDREGRRGWTHRQGWRTLIPPGGPGEVVLSDLLFLADADSDLLPDRLEDHLDRVVISDTLDAGPVALAWEIYGEPEAGERVPLVLTLERGEPGLLRRLGEFLRVARRFEPVDVRWEEPLGADEDAGLPFPTRFRTIRLDLSGLPSGAWVVRLSLPEAGSAATAGGRAESGPGERGVLLASSVRTFVIR